MTTNQPTTRLPRERQHPLHPTDEAMERLEQTARASGSSNCWTGTSGTMAAAVVQLLDVVRSYEQRLAVLERDGPHDWIDANSPPRNNELQLVMEPRGWSLARNLGWWDSIEKRWRDRDDAAIDVRWWRPWPAAPETRPDKNTPPATSAITRMMVDLPADQAAELLRRCERSGLDPAHLGGLMLQLGLGSQTAV